MSAYYPTRQKMVCHPGRRLRMGNQLLVDIKRPTFLTLKKIEKIQKFGMAQGLNLRDAPENYELSLGLEDY